MSSFVPPVNPARMRVYLRSLRPPVRQAGVRLFQEASFDPLTCLQPGIRYQCTVTAESTWRVAASYDEAQGWSTTCSCPQVTGCAHGYAVLKLLLAESSVDQVRQLSGGKTTPTGERLPAPPAPEPPRPLSLREQLIAALNRPLRRKESAFLERVERLFQFGQMSRYFTAWEFQSLDFHATCGLYDDMRLWPSFPSTDAEFWNFLAVAAIEQGNTLPPFMLPVTDLESYRARSHEWKRQEQVRHWENELNRVSPQSAWTAASPPEIHEIRLVFNAEGAILETRAPNQPAFAALGSRQLRQISAEVDSGSVCLAADAAGSWPLLRAIIIAGHNSPFPYRDGVVQRSLGALVRLPTALKHLVGPDGLPLQVATTPLRWRLMPPPTSQDDYQVLLDGEDGFSIDEFMTVFEGRPSLYLVGHTLHPGPSPLPASWGSRVSARIPGAALSTRAGLHFLQHLGIPLPPEFASRIRTVRLRPRIQCTLGPLHRYARSEVCRVQVFAQTEDGIAVEEMQGTSWASTEKPAHTPTPGEPNAPIVIYDRTALEEVPRWLSPLGLKIDAHSGCLAVRVKHGFPEQFTAWLESLPPEVAVDLLGDLASLREGTVGGRVRLEATEVDIDWFDLRVALDVADTTLTPDEIKMLLAAKGGFVRLKNKGWRRLHFDLTDEENHQLAHLGLSPKELDAEPQRLHALQLADAAARRWLPEAQAERVERRIAELKMRVTPPVPAAVRAELRPYQREGFHFLAYLTANRFGGVLADDMGLGKTLQTLAWLVWLSQESGRESAPTAPAGSPTLVVCPKSVMDNWRAEAERFVPGLRVRVWRAEELADLRAHLGEVDLHVLNYSQLRLFSESLASVSWRAVILDEAQYIKNPGSQTALAARALRAEYRLVLTGTPIENRLLDLWSLMAFAMPGILGNRARFARVYDAKGDPLARQRLSARVRPFLLRRTKSQVAQDLPDRIEEDLFCELEGIQLTLYQAELKHARQMLLRIQTDQQLNRARFHFLTSLLRLRQICCHPALVHAEISDAGAKTEALLELLEPLMEEGQKVLVFSQFVALLDMLRPTLASHQWPLFELTGETENRGALIQRFQETRGAAVFLISLKAGGFGLNLTAASYVVLFDPWWNPAVERQAIDRTHRIGQTSKVIAYRLLIKHSIEEKIRLLQRQKNSLAQDVLGEERFAESLTLDDLRFLLTDTGTVPPEPLPTQSQHAGGQQQHGSHQSEGGVNDHPH